MPVHAPNQNEKKPSTGHFARCVLKIIGVSVAMIRRTTWKMRTQNGARVAWQSVACVRVVMAILHRTCLHCAMLSVGLLEMRSVRNVIRLGDVHSAMQRSAQKSAGVLAKQFASNVRKLLSVGALVDLSANIHLVNAQPRYTT